MGFFFGTTPTPADHEFTLIDFLEIADGGAPPVDHGYLWVNSSNHLIYTDESDVDHDVSHGGGAIQSRVQDADNDTSVDVEPAPDSDDIQFQSAGNVMMYANQYGLSFNRGGTAFIPTPASPLLDLSDPGLNSVKYSLHNGAGHYDHIIDASGNVEIQLQDAKDFKLANASGGELLSYDHGASEIIVNESGAAVDFRVEGDTNANMLYVDAAGSQVGIGTGAPGKRLDVYNGTVPPAAVGSRTRNIAGSYSVDIDAGGNTTVAASSDVSYTGGNYSIQGANMGVTATASYSRQVQTSNSLFQNASGTTFNSGNNDVDFSVKGDSGAHMLYVDAGNDRVGVGTNTPDTTMEVVTGGNYLRLSGTGGGSPVGGLEVINETSSDNAFFTLDSGGNLSVEASKDLRLDAAASRELIVNSLGTDTDFRVESDNNANMLCVDAGNDRVGIGTNSPSQFFDAYTGNVGAEIIGVFQNDTAGLALSVDSTSNPHLDPDTGRLNIGQTVSVNNTGLSITNAGTPIVPTTSLLVNSAVTGVGPTAIFSNTADGNACGFGINNAGDFTFATGGPGQDIKFGTGLAPSDIVVDTTNSYVGVATASPSETLDVNGNSRIRGYEEMAEIASPGGTPAANRGWWFVDTADSKPKFKNDGGTVYDLTTSAISGDTIQDADSDTIVSTVYGGADSDVIGFNCGGTNMFQMDATNGLTLREIATPGGSPAAGYGWLYPDSADSALKFKDDSGTEHNLLTPTAIADSLGTTGVDAGTADYVTTTVGGVTASQYEKIGTNVHFGLGTAANANDSIRLYSGAASSNIRMINASTGTTTTDGLNIAMNTDNTADFILHEAGKTIQFYIGGTTTSDLQMHLSDGNELLSRGIGNLTSTGETLTWFNDAGSYVMRLNLNGGLVYTLADGNIKFEDGAGGTSTINTASNDNVKINLVSTITDHIDFFGGNATSPFQVYEDDARFDVLKSIGNPNTRIDADTDSDLFSVYANNVHCADLSPRQISINASGPVDNGDPQLVLQQHGDNLDNGMVISSLSAGDWHMAHSNVGIDQYLKIGYDDGSTTTDLEIRRNGIINLPEQSACQLNLYEGDQNYSNVTGRERVDFQDQSTPNYDRRGEWDNTNHRFTATESGLYQVNVGIHAEIDMASGNLFHVWANCQTSQDFIIDTFHNHTGGGLSNVDVYLNGSCIVELDAAETFDIQVEHSASNQSYTIYDENNTTYCMIHKLS